MLSTVLLSLVPHLGPAGDTPPPGPPWITTHRQARLDALAHGRPVFVYFTKHY
jgi:hypothetical protein